MKDDLMGKIGWILTIVVLLGLFFIFSPTIFGGSSNPLTGRATSIEEVIIRKPQLSLTSLDKEGHWGLSKGCYVTVSGAVVNNGNGDAYNAIVTCTTSEGSQQHVVGTVNAHDSKTFTFNLDTSCFKKETGSCYVSCDNC